MNYSNRGFFPVDKNFFTKVRVAISGHRLVIEVTKEQARFYMELHGRSSRYQRKRVYDDIELGILW